MHASAPAVRMFLKFIKTVRTRSVDPDLEIQVILEQLAPGFAQARISESPELTLARGIPGSTDPLRPHWQGLLGQYRGTPGFGNSTNGSSNGWPSRGSVSTTHDTYHPWAPILGARDRHTRIGRLPSSGLSLRRDPHKDPPVRW